ncbi:MAG: hypothetical protein U0354_16440 [Candidatus Sericytochromatia bacterium]
MNKVEEKEEYLKRYISKLAFRVSKLNSINNNYIFLRVIVFLSGIALTILAYSSFNKTIGTLTLLISIIAFFITIYFHNKVIKSIEKHNAWIIIKGENIARLNIDWDKIPESHIKNIESNHPFATDIDIIGKNSIYRLIDISVSENGSKKLLDMLTNLNPDKNISIRNQNIVKELKDLTLFRDKIRLETFIQQKKEYQKWNGEKLLSWVKKDNSIDELKKVLNISSVLLILAYISLVGTLIGLNAFIWKALFIIYAIYFFMNDEFAKSFFRESLALEYELRKINNIFTHIEKFDFGNKKNLAEFCACFKEDEYRPSNYMRRIKNLLASANIQSNPVMWLLTNAIFPWDFFHGYRLKKYKSQISTILPIWLEKFYELEALSSLANFSWLNEEYIFPDFLEKNDNTEFDFKEVGHPLLNKDKKVCNNFSMNEKDVIIITGSNMAGKSTFLRTLGVNLCLAYAGAPVNAKSFNTKMFRLFTCIRVSDSVTDGLSYFYAEVKRLKALIDELNKKNDISLFFLVDEIFRGTNNRERLLGSRAYIKALTGSNGLGFISTHDLELVKLAEEIKQIKNYHFRDDVIDDKMIFNYKIQEGACPTTNALKIMKIEGLPVD